MAGPDLARPSLTPGADPTSSIQPLTWTGHASTAPPPYPIGKPNWYEPSDFAPPGPNALSGYTLKYSQDFRVGGSLPTGWAAFDGTPGDDPGAEWSPSNVAVKDGMLELTTTRNPADHSEWISGGVCDCGEPMTYGAYFVRSRITGPGPSQVELLWPADNQWPPEVDFAESWGDTNEIQGTDHYGTGSNAALNAVKVNLRKWHTFGMVWTPKSITYILNGHAWWTFSDASEIPNLAMTLDLDQQTWCSAGWACPGSTEALDVDWIAEYTPST
jgi:beta-glucanase (GH16 family)